MSNRLKGKVALVTAAGQGIGRAIAEAFIAEGAKVIATDLAEDKLKDLHGRQARKNSTCARRTISTRSPRRSRANSARSTFWSIAPAMCANGSVLDCTDKDWDFSFDLNVKSMHRTIKAFLPAMLEKKSGSIVNISSAVSSIRGVPNRYVYGATKAAVIGLTKAVAADFIKQGIRCNAICPGTIELPSLEERIAAVSQQTGTLARRGAAGFHRPPADGPAGNAAGSRRARPLSRQRRGELHYRPGPSRRRRDGAVVCHHPRKRMIQYRVSRVCGDYWMLRLQAACRPGDELHMHILITGAAGMIGRKLTARLVNDGALAGRPIEQADADRCRRAAKARTNLPATSKPSPPILPIRRPCAPAVAGRPDAIFHLAAVVSGEAELDFDKGMRVNLDGSRALLEAIRTVGDGYRPRVVFTSSIAVFGAPFPATIGDDFHLTPLTSYGTQKAMVELLLADYTPPRLSRRRRHPAADHRGAAGPAK